MRLSLNETQYIETDRPIDISIPLHNNESPVLAWYCEPIKIEPVMTEHFVGDVNQGGSVNFKNIFLNPHGNGTHTECVGHISKEPFTINKCLREFHFDAQLISVEAQKVYNKNYEEDDLVITRNVLEPACSDIGEAKALVIRTIPNETQKLSKNYSNTNPPYFSTDAIEYINELNVDHLLVDLPSIDREVDGGALSGHHIFWNYPNKPLTHKTITELIYVPDNVEDGRYVMNIQITSLESDASPSKIVLFDIRT